jgi:hypothetical protein
VSEEYPLFPTLTPEAQIDAQRLMDSFKVKMTLICKETLSDLYCDVSAYIESDQWQNFRNELLEGLCNYNNSKIMAEYDFKKIRQAILKEHRNDIIADLNADMVKEIEELKIHIEFLQDRRY